MHRPHPFRLTALVGAVAFLPTLVVSVVLWHVLSGQIFSAYEKRLATSLETFSLLIEGRHRNLRDALSRIAADNTVQITLDLDIQPQLRRYLKSQHEAAKLDFIQVADRLQGLIGSAGSVPAGIARGALACGVDTGEPSEAVARFSGDLYFVRSVPVIQDARVLGYLCAGSKATDDEFLDFVTRKLDGVPVYWWNGSLISAGGRQRDFAQSVHDGEVFDFASNDVRHKGMFSPLKDGQGGFRVGFLVTLKELDEGIRRAMATIALVFLGIAAVSLFALRTLRQRREAESLLHEEKERAVVTLASIADGVVTTDASGRITYLNPAAEELTGYSARESLGRPWREVLNIRGQGGSVALPGPNARAGIFTAPEDSVLQMRNGKETDIHFSAAPIGGSEDESRGVALVLRDVGPERELRRRLAWKASRDDLTGLYNRAEFRHRVSDAVADAAHRQVEHTLLYVDLDEFKVVNDTCGHHAGDELLQQISGLLLTHIRAADTVARLGGDEFGILLTACPLERGVKLASGILDAINDHRFSHGDRVFSVGASIGAVAINEENRDLGDLMASVDAACYVAKEQGRNRVHAGRVDEERTGRRLDELRLASIIRQALKEERFVLYQQPIVSVSEREASGPIHSEVLIRMRDTDGREMPPGAFIPVAERYGLMPEIDRWVVNRVFATQSRQLRLATPTGAGSSPSRTPDARSSQYVLTINLSGASLGDNEFLAFIKTKLKEHRIPGSMVYFEITETAVITHLDKARRFIAELRELGCRFLLDDFGSGMSSFGYLKHLPVDFLKIDGLFVKDMVDDPIDRSMVKAINDIGHEMNLRTVAEFVENDAILAELRKLGVDMAQGYGIAMPVPLDGEALAASA